MLKVIYYRTDIKRIMRDQIMALLMTAPLLIVVIFKMIWIFVLPIVEKHFGLDLSSYIGYVLSLILILIAGMVAMVMGFSMQEDKDSNMTMFFGITPLGRNGYMFIRLSLVSMFVMAYSIIGYLILGLYVPLINFIAILCMLCMLACVMGIALYKIAKDKVQGLTIAKALNIVIFFIFGNLTDNKIIQAICSIFPTYWIGKTILYPENMTILVIGLLVNAGWFCLALLVSGKIGKDDY